MTETHEERTRANTISLDLFSRPIRYFCIFLISLVISHVSQQYSERGEAAATSFVFIEFDAVDK